MPQIILGSDFCEVVLPLIAAAKNRINIVVFDWRVYPDQLGVPISQFNLEIFKAVQRGVKIQAIVNNTQDLQKLKNNGVITKKLVQKTIVHTKLMIIDDQLIILGSHNYTLPAMEQNFELSVCFDVPTADNQYNDYFAKLWLL